METHLTHLPIKAYELIKEDGLLMLRTVGHSDTIIIYSSLPVEEIEKFTSHITQPFTLIKAGLAPLELK